MLYAVLAILAFFITTHELARRHRARTFLVPERLRDLWRWRLSPLPRRRAMARKSILDWWAAAHVRLELPAPPKRPAIEFGSSLKHALAWADSSNLRIRVSEVWLQKLAWGDVHQTMGHEVAHLITDLYAAEPKPHGPAWKRTMKSLGLPPTVTFDANRGAESAPELKAEDRPESKPQAKSPREPKPSRPHAAGRTRRSPRV